MLSKKHFVALSEFRARLARFLHFSEQAAIEAGLTPLQYLMLLHLHGFPDRDWATVGELAERLQASHQGTVALVQRSERNGLVRKRRSAEDARRVEIHLTPKARALTEQVAVRHRDELSRLGEVFRIAHVTPPAARRKATAHA